MSTYSPSVEQITDGNGKPIVGARKHFFEIGTTTFKTIYSDPALTTPLTNPIKSDADGRYPTIYLDGLYKVVQEDASGTDLFLLDGTTLWTEEQVGESPSTTQFALWDTTATYNIPDIVLGSDDNYYRSLTDTNTGNNPTTTATSWELLIFGREWNTNVTYAVGDVVYGTDGLLYTSRTAANLGNDPTTDLVNWNGKIRHDTVASALNTVKLTDSATGLKPKIDVDGEDVGLDIEGVELHNGVVTGDIIGNVAGNIKGDYIKLEEQQTSGTAAGALTSGSWQTRVLNTEVADTGNLTSIVSNQFSLPAGSYSIKATAPATSVNSHQIRLYNVTDAAAEITGQNAYASSAGSAGTHAHVNGEFTILSTKTFQIEHRVQTTGGGGFQTSWGTEIYTSIEIWKLD